MTDIDLTQYPDTVRELGEQRAKVFLDRYARKGPNGQPIEDHPTQMWSRVAMGIAGDDPSEGLLPSEEARRFYNLLTDFKFVPGGRILAGAGTGTEVTFYNCYVVPVETKSRREQRRHITDGGGFTNGLLASDPGNDSREAINDTVGVMVDIMSRGGGVGINWSVLRPSGAHLETINATSSGPIPWMHWASVAVGTVEQGGSRRGAAMFMLDDWHPDLLAFIDAKRDESLITNANVSVCISDDFMRLVEQDGEWDFVFPDTSFRSYDAEWDGDLDAWLGKGYPVRTYGTMKARDIWRKLAEAAHASGEPGVVFLDRYNKRSTAAGVERIISVNPCGEQGLGPYSVCNLGAMNLAAYIRTDGMEGDSLFRWAAFYDDVQTAVRFLDRVIDENYYFLPENEKVQKELRRIGLGVMGLADALVYMGIRYGSPNAVEFTEEVFRMMKHAALNASARLAKEKGPAPAWKDAMLAQPYLDDLLGEQDGSDVYQRVSEHGLRNLFLLTQAPTGTTSILAGVNSGIEPFFALGYWREDRTGKHWVEPKAIAYDKADHIAKTGEYSGILPSYVVTASEVTVEEHIAMQAAVQKYVDSSVSKTINAPNDQTVDEVEKAYRLAYDSGLKGLAYYRDGSRQEQVLRRDGDPKAALNELTHLLEDEGLIEQNQSLTRRVEELESELDGYRKQPGPYSRPDVLTGRTHKVRSGSHTAYVTVNRDGEGRAVEAFVSVGKSGTSMMEMGEAMGRLASIGLQKGLSLDDIIDQLDGVGNNGLLGRSLPSAIAAALKADIEAEDEAGQKVSAFYGEVARVVIAETGQDLSRDVKEVTIEFSGDLSSAWGPETEEWAPAGDLCPECGGQTLIREEGCQKCHACGYAAC